MEHKDIVADLHTHTIASGHAFSTVAEMVTGAQQKGLKMLAITDHGPNLPGGPHLYHFSNGHIIPRQYPGLELLWGVEANIVDVEGNLDVPEQYLDLLDIVLAGFHPEAGYDNRGIEDNTRAFIAAVRHPRVQILTHPGNPYYPVDYERVIPAAKAYGTAIEINNSSFTGFRKGSFEVCCEVAKIAKRHGAPLVINSDAHIACQIGTFDKSLEVARIAGLEVSDVINTSIESIRAHLKGKKARVEACR
ncbi:MAG TPA: phosphatase [Cyanobacteria bacterium UBA8530]|nr:phosphatase [Cyanobacteria bacterium UBA8530]